VKNKSVAAVQHDTYIGPVPVDCNAEKGSVPGGLDKEKFMNFKEKYPDFAAIESQVRRARVERAIYLSQAIIAGVQAVIGGVKRLGIVAARGVEAERDRRAVQADAFLKRSVPRY
jgi:hypothetical protein